MKNVKSKDTNIEILLRKALWHYGYRYVKNSNVLPGRPDIVLPKYRIAIFCDGEFFHGKDWELLSKQIAKGNNSDYWMNKIQRNIEHDEEVNKALLSLGWIVLRFWGKDIEKNPIGCVRVIDDIVLAMQANVIEEKKNGRVS